METRHVDTDMETFKLRCLFFCMLRLFVRVERTVGRSISIFAVVAIVAAPVSVFCCNIYLMLIHSMLSAVLGSVSVLAFLLVLLLLFAALSPLAACGVALAPALGSQFTTCMQKRKRFVHVHGCCIAGEWTSCPIRRMCGCLGGGGAHYRLIHQTSCVHLESRTSKTWSAQVHHGR